MSLAGYASTNPKKVDEANWKQAKSNNTIEAYLKYLRNANSLYRAHEIEAKTQLKSLMQADLASVREVVVTNEATAVVGRKLTSAGLVKLVSDALQRQGYHVVESDVPNRVIVSLSGKHFLSGTASSYWHFGSAQGGTLSC